MVQGRTVLFRTAEGAKLFSAVAKCAVAFEADDHNVAEGWSVIVKVRAQVLTTDAGVREAERAQLLPWTATLKRHCVRVIPWRSPAATSGSVRNRTAARPLPARPRHTTSDSAPRLRVTLRRLLIATSRATASSIPRASWPASATTS